jgi:maleate isomerase
VGDIRPSEYGSRGIVGIGVPQANPTVEQELFALRPAGLSLVTTRLTSQAESLEQRLLDYLYETPHYAGRYDDLSIDAFGIACTGSSYLVGPDEDARLAADLSVQLGYPVVTAAVAIRRSLSALGARRIAIVSPYPDWLGEKALSFWRAAGFEIGGYSQVALAGENVHAIYELGSADALAAARQLDTDSLDAIVFTGTGMPSLGALTPLHEETGLPVMSSNLCLLTALARELKIADQPLLAVPAGINAAEL